jgi:hypothetical protein
MGRTNVLIAAMICVIFKPDSAILVALCSKIKKRKFQHDFVQMINCLKTEIQKSH